MMNKQYLRYASLLSLVALALLLITIWIATQGQHFASQEIFETITDAASYSAALAQAAPDLKKVLFVDALFALAYTSAICFAALAFYQRNPPLAWFTGLGIIAVMGLDYLENIIMVQSMALISLGHEISLEQIVWQMGVSSAKWHSAAVALFAISFLLPDDTLIEKLLVWGTRLGLAIAVPLFVIDAFAMRQLGGALILASMAGGFILLAWVTWKRATIDK